MVRLNSILFLHFCFILSAGAQPGIPPRTGEPLAGFPFGLVYYEALNAPSGTPGLSRIDVPYRIDLSFFVAVRDPSNPLFSDFVRKGEVQIELMDSTGMTAARKIQRFEEPGKSTEAKPGSLWHLGLVSLDLVPAEYTISFTIEDLESERSVSEKIRRVTAKDFAPDHATIASPFFITPPEGSAGDSLLLFPTNFGGGIEFGQPGTIVLQATHETAADPPPVRIRITTPGRKTEKDSIVVESANSPVTILRNSVVLPELFQNRPAYRVARSDRQSTIIILPLPAEELPPGAHLLTITIGEKTLTHPFAVVWPAMPRSLMNPEYAFESLRFITTSDELDSLTSGSEEERREHFDEFWAARDRTPGTAFNEVMSEYYSRVDHAAATFGTLRNPDGTRTDRGRIHILYGNPTRVERNLDPSGFIEVWSYESARKKFIFLDETKTGNYVLTSTRPL